MKVSGANNMLEMRKGNRRYILIGDFHHGWSKNNCKDKDSILITEFLHKLFTKDPETQWNFYLETSHDPFYNYSMKERSLYGKITSPKYLDYYARKITGLKWMPGLVMNYFKTFGCFSNVECKIKNTRFHFGDVRTTDYCGYNILDHSQSFNLIPGQLVDIWDLNKDNTAHKIAPGKLIDIHLNYLKKAVHCLEFKKIKKQLKEAYNSDKLMNYYQPIVRYIKDYALYYINGIEKNKVEILERFKKVANQKDYDDFIDYLDKITIDMDLVKKNKKTNDELISALHPDTLLFTNKAFLNTGAFIISDVVVSGFNLVMDMYLMGRSFREFDGKKQDNVVILAGDAHIHSYVHLLKHLGFKTVWKSKQLGKEKPSYLNKCSFIPNLLEGETKFKTEKKTKKKKKKKKTKNPKKKKKTKNPKKKTNTTENP